jgi:GT2 family glycosyltransferase
MKISFLIVNWNAGEYLLKCLQSIQENFTFEKVIWIVDNNSTDISLELVKKNYPEANIIANSENLGYAKANNIGLKKIKTNYCVLLNPDVIILPGSIEKLIDLMETKPKAAIATPHLIYYDKTTQESYGHFPSVVIEFIRFLGINKIWHFLRKQFKLKNAEQPIIVDWAFGACFLARMNALNQIKGFDESYFMYSEDLDLCRRLHDNGWEIWFHPSSIVMHYSSLSADKKWNSIEKYINKYNGFYNYLEKYHNKLALKCFSVIFILDLVKKLILFQNNKNTFNYYKRAISYQIKKLFSKTLQD